MTLNRKRQLGSWYDGRGWLTLSAVSASCAGIDSCPGCSTDPVPSLMFLRKALEDGPTAPTSGTQIRDKEEVSGSASMITLR